MSNDANPHSTCLAVMPFENLSGNPDHDYFASGFVEDLITDLSRFHSLQMIASFTSGKIGARAGDTMSEAKKLSIDYLLKGNLRRRGGQIRINTQLIETAGNRILWAERYDAPLDTIFDIQDDIVERVSGAISDQIDRALLAAARQKPLISLAAYDCWLRGLAHLRKGTPEADLKARQTFEQALTIDPHYGRAYAGLSLSYFNDWSCQLWERWEETERNAYQYARQAIELDDGDHITQLILGRILLYRRQFDVAEEHVDRSLALNANDADILIQIATAKGFLGKAPDGETLFEKAMRLNPYKSIWYYTGGAFAYFAQGNYEACIHTALKGPLTDVWIDLPAYIAAAFAHMGDTKQAARYLGSFRKIFQKMIATDHEASAEEIIRWEKKANPFRRSSDLAKLIDGLLLAGLDERQVQKDSAPHRHRTAPAMPALDKFKKESGFWLISYEDKSVSMPEVKGFHDLARLMATPGVEIHCTQMMGNPDTMSEDVEVMDEKAMQSYEARIRELREEIREIEEMNDLGRKEKLTAELEQLTDHLSKALGMGGRTRRLNAPAERARAAVTWRVRSAIKKIEAAHPPLGRHLANAIRTGTFCSYNPEKVPRWLL